MRRFALPLALFLVLVLFLARGLGLNPRELPSPLVGKPAPQLVAERAAPPGAMSTGELRGQVWLLNVWASWCAPCRVEHPLLADLARRRVVPVVGLNYKDARADSTAWLRQHGDPYLASAFDTDGRLGIEWGVYGVPETFVIDKAGVVRLRYAGPLTPEVLAQRILPLVEELNRG